MNHNRMNRESGATRNHPNRLNVINRISRNCINVMSTAADSMGCDVYFSDIKVRCEQQQSYYYPDVVVSCEDDDSDEYYLNTPCLIIEVTSTSTLRKDYLEKALAYQTIPSLQAYLIIAQDRAQVDMLERQVNGNWALRQFDTLTDIIALPCLQHQIDLNAIYQGIELE